MKRLMPVVLLCAVLLAACETTQWPTWGQRSSATDLDDLDLGPSGLAMSSAQRFPDVPVPAGTTEDRERSFVHESSAIQVGRMVYKTRSSVADVAQFYIREAPAANWRLEKVTEAQGAELLFLKPGRRLTVTVENMGFIRGRRLTLLYVPEGGAGNLL